jgi:transcription elongation factor GreA
VTTGAQALTNPFAPSGDFASAASRLDSSLLDEAEAWAASLSRHPQAGEWRKRGEKLVAEPQAPPLGHFAFAALLASLGERAEAARQMVALCERLAQVPAWPQVALVADRALEIEPLPPAARWLVKAADETDGPEGRFAALRRAHEAAPGEAQLARRLADAHRERGEVDAARTATARALEALARRRDGDALEELLLPLLESSAREELRLALPPLVLYAKGGEAPRVATLLELAWPRLESAGLAAETWAALRTMLVESADPSRLIPLVPAVVTAALPEGGGARTLLEESGFGGADPPRLILERFDRLLPFAPGKFAEHGSWGVGRVRRLAGDEVWIDFPNRPEHRMTLRAAHQALRPADPEDLSTLAAWRPERLSELRQRDPGGLVARALRRLGGEASTTDLKRLFARTAVPDSEWSSFWNATRPRLATDSRLDVSQAYRGRYSLRPGVPLDALASSPAPPTAARASGSTSTPEVGETVALPRFDRGADARKVLTTLRKFLAQHPGRAGALVRERGGILRAWRDDPTLPWRERVGALLLLAGGLDADAIEDAPRLAEAAVGAHFEVRELPSVVEQRQMLEWGLAASNWEATARSALASRFADVQNRAFEALAERWSERASDRFSTLARRAVSMPEPALAAMNRAFSGRTSTRDTAGWRIAPWEAALGIAELLEGGTTETRLKAALALLVPNGPLARSAETELAPAEVCARLERLLLHWRGSDRGLLPFLAWAASAGLPDLAENVRERRRSAARAITASGGTAAAHELQRTFCTRSTHERLRREAESIDQALRGEIPAAIQKARELGDLRENAEYESAKLKQRQAQARLQQLLEKLADLSFIDDLVPDEETAGLGAEVEVEEPNGSLRRLWILGEGDDHLGPEVVSYRAPLGKAMLGRRAGDRVTVPGDGGERSLLVRAVRLRRPPLPGSGPAA